MFVRVVGWFDFFFGKGLGFEFVGIVRFLVFFEGDLVAFHIDWREVAADFGLVVGLVD